jgi:hypothetical protein
LAGFLHRKAEKTRTPSACFYVHFNPPHSLPTVRRVVAFDKIKCGNNAGSNHFRGLSDSMLKLLGKIDKIYIWTAKF